MISRRGFVWTTALAGLSLASGSARAALPGSLGDGFARIERDSGGRLGVAVLDTETGSRGGYHADDLFPMCSTFKLLACAAVLKRVDDGKEKLERRIVIEASDVVPGSSRITAPVGGDGMALSEVCQAAMTYSDNTAGNLILKILGGPAGLTAYARTIGDTVTRLDRTEPTLNEAVPGDPRDTTTPAAMLKNMQTLVLGDTLSAASKQQLTAWLIGNKTGDTRIRAGLPAAWRCGDKTGTGERGSTNDIAVVWPTQRKPILVTAYLTETTAPAEKRNSALAAVGRAVAGAIGAK